MAVLEIDRLTKDYGHGRGVFDVTFQVEKGEVYGFLGPNGAGKTTTIRHIMGFSKPQQGQTMVNGRDSWKYAHEIQKELGYLPGELALPENMNGTAFIRHDVLHDCVHAFLIAICLHVNSSLQCFCIVEAAAIAYDFLLTKEISEIK